MQSCSLMKIQINTSLHQGAFSFSLPKPWQVAAAQRRQLCKVALSMRRATSSDADSTRCEQWGWRGWLHSALSDFQRFCQPCTAQTEIAPLCPKPNLFSAKRGNVLTHHLIVWWVLWSTLFSLSSPTHNLGVVTEKRTSEKCSKPESQENPTDFHCVLCCVATQSSWKKKYTADLGTSYISSLKMPFKAHVKNEATRFLLQQFV